jgi:hypothetical protein
MLSFAAIYIVITELESLSSKYLLRIVDISNKSGSVILKICKLNTFVETKVNLTIAIFTLFNLIKVQFKDRYQMAYQKRKPKNGS